MEAKLLVVVHQLLERREACSYRVAYRIVRRSVYQQVMQRKEPWMRRVVPSGEARGPDGANKRYRPLIMDFDARANS
jgi:hypothetical protein